MSDQSKMTSETSPAGTFLLTPAQHRGMARMLREIAGQPNAPTPERAEQMARNHEVMAKVIEHRQAKAQTKA